MSHDHVHEYTRNQSGGPSVSIAWKITIPIALGAAALAAFLWSRACNEASATIERETDLTGAQLVTALAVSDPASWSSVRGTFLDTAERLVEDAPQYEDFLRVKYGLTIMPPSDSSRRKSLSDEFKKQQERVFGEYERVKTQNRGRLGGLLSFVVPADAHAPPTRILDAFVLRESTGRSVARAQSDGEAFAARRGVRRLALADNGLRMETDVTIRDGVYATHPARSFDRPIHDATGAITHRAFVFLSTEEVEAAVAAMKGRTLPIAGIALLLACAAAFCVTRVVTAPLRKLQADAAVIAAGDLHHRASVKTDDEIGLLSRTMDTMVRRLDHALADYDDEVAADLHRKLVAEEIPYLSHVEIAVMPILTQAVGGAYYDMLELPDTKVGFVLAEASARGIAAAVNVCMAGALLKAEARSSCEPDELLRRVDEPLYRAFHEEMKLDAVVAVLDSKAKTVRIAGAGDLPVFVYRDATDQLEEIRLSGLKLGVDPGPRFDASLEAVTVELGPGDRLLMTNDNAEHVVNVHDEELGRERWRSFLKKACSYKSSEFVAELRQLLRGFGGRHPIDDDIVVLSLCAASVPAQLAGSA